VARRPAGFLRAYLCDCSERPSDSLRAGRRAVRRVAGEGNDGRRARWEVCDFVLADDERRGISQPQVFVPNLPATQGILFANGQFYFQDDTKIMKLAYSAGDRAPRAPPVQVADLSKRYQSGVHWPKALDIADDGTIYVANGSDQAEDTSDCSPTRPMRGGIYAILRERADQRVHVGGEGSREARSDSKRRRLGLSVLRDEERSIRRY